MRTFRLRAALLGAVLLPLLAGTGSSATAQAAAGEWQNGKHDEDTIIDCITGRPGTGVSADVSWRGVSDRVPRVGETFYVRGYAGLVSLPCSGTVAVVPEFLIPAGTEYADDETHPVRWALTKRGETQHLSTRQLGYFQGANGGVTFETPGGGSWTLRQGDVLEIQVPVRATRELRGPATQQPECEDRREGTAPCPVTQAGDHLQVAFTVGGHGGDKYYVTPYVGLFAANGPGGPGDPGDPGDPATKAASRTTATYAVSSRARGRAVVTVRSSVRPSGRVVVLDRGRRIGAARLTAAQHGHVRVALPRMAQGRHVLVVRYGGSATVRPSQSAVRTVTLR
jgi:hypothetical protein